MLKNEIMDSAARWFVSSVPSSPELMCASLFILVALSAAVEIFLVDIEGSFMSTSWAATLYFTSLFMASFEVIVIALSTSGCEAPRLSCLNRFAVECEL